MAARIASLAINRSSSPRAGSSGGDLVVRELVAGPAQVGDQSADQ
jgi:hypothetical protein